MSIEFAGLQTSEVSPGGSGAGEVVFVLQQTAICSLPKQVSLAMT